MCSYDIRKKQVWKVGNNKREEVECIFVALLYNNWYVRTLDYSSPQHTLIPNVYTVCGSKSLFLFYLLH